MKADITRNSFDPLKHYSRVLMQQGRVQLDADWNEQTDILLHYLRTVVQDILGPCAAPAEHAGFQLIPDPDNLKTNFRLSPGRIYVNGILVENDNPDATYPNPENPPDKTALKQGTNYGIYLDVWERHITSIEDPNVREVALGGPDTCTRAQVVWQVRTIEAEPLDGAPQCDELIKNIQDSLGQISDLRNKLANEKDKNRATEIRGEIARLRGDVINLRGKLANCDADHWCKGILTLPTKSDSALKAQVELLEDNTDVCIQAPSSQYRGDANRLYRVEIHRGGIGLANDGDKIDDGTATFKWSRDNGSLATGFLGIQGQDLTVQSARGFAANGWVELTELDSDLIGKTGTMLRLVAVEGNTLTFDANHGAGGADFSEAKVVRSWNQRATGDHKLYRGAMPVVEGEWIPLENGIQVWFQPGGEYRTGDYWLIPARVTGGVIEWPMEGDEPQALPPQGIDHYYAPLGVINWNEQNNIDPKPCTCTFEAKCKP